MYKKSWPYGLSKIGTRPEKAETLAFNFSNHIVYSISTGLPNATKLAC